MKITHKIPTREYCDKPLYVNTKEYIKDIVKREDEYNHAKEYKPVEIPKMRYPTGKTWSRTGIHALISKILP